MNEVNSTYRPRLSYYHPNAKGTGSAVCFELHPAHDSTDGSIFCTIAAQKTLGSFAGDTRVFPSFDWANRICVKLDMTDLSQIMQVFRGMQENIGDGKGLFHRSAKANTVIRLEHRIEPTPGYVLDFSKKPLDGDPVRLGILFSPTEALGLSLAIEQSMSVIAFGIPMVLARVGNEPSDSEPLGLASPVTEDLPF